MAVPAELYEIKRRLSGRLLQLPGVSGVGLPGGTLTIYLAKDSADIRRGVAALLETEAPGTTVDYVVTGSFHRQ